MSNIYRMAMLIDTAQWDFSEDTDFAMSILLEKTIDLLTAGRKPSLQDIFDIPWIETDDPAI